MPDGDAGPSVKGVSPKNPSAREAPRACLSRHARRPPRARPVHFRATGRPPPFDRDAEEVPQAGLLPPGPVRPGLVPRPADVRRLGAGFGLSQATAYRYLSEVIDVLAEQAPGVREALERAVSEGTPYVILDGKVVDADRCHEKTLSRKGKVIDLWYSGKKKDFGGNVQALFYPDVRPMWVADVLPGNFNDLSAAREMVLSVIGEFSAELPCLADGGYEGAGHGILTPVKKPKGTKEPGINDQTRNALIRSVRCKGERGFALLSQRWKTLLLVTMSPGRIGEIARCSASRRRRRPQDQVRVLMSPGHLRFRDSDVSSELVFPSLPVTWWVRFDGG